MVEVIEIKNLLGKTLVGDFYCAKDENKDKVVLLVHGFMAGRKWNGRFVKIAEELAKNNINVYSFDLSGCGDSDDENISISSGILDVRCILSYIRFQKYSKIGLLGHSLGGIISLEQSLEKVNSLCLLAPVTNKIEYSFDERFGKLVMNKMRNDGFFDFKGSVSKGYREFFRVSSKIEEERSSIVPEEVLGDCKVPTLIIHGDKDDMIPVSDSENAMKFLSSESRLEIISGEGHLFDLNLEKVSLKVSEWFNETL
jgi:pimeloyl-ACP methyl ester carboxylesterase